MNIAGLLKKRIELQSVTLTADTGGGFTSRWATTNTVWANMQPVDKGREFYDVRQLQKSLGFVFTIRYLANVTPKMRIKFGTRLFNIRSVVNMSEKNEILRISAEEFVAV